MQSVIDDFNASQDRIFVKMLTVSSIDQKFMLAVAGGNPPDVVGIWLSSLHVFAERGALMPLDRMINDAGMSRDDYIPVYWDVCEHRGMMWALPSTPATLALHYNRQLFIDAGLDPDVAPKSIAELDEIAEKLTIVRVTRDGESIELRYTELTEAERTAKEFSLVQLGFSPAIPGWWDSLWGNWFGGSLLEDGNRVTAASAENTKAYNWYRSYIDKFGLNNMQKFGQSFGNFASPQDPFLSGKVAMVLQGVWLHNFIEKYNPDINWAAVPFPSYDPEVLPNVTLAECDMLAIPRGALHVEEAFEFIKYVNSQKGSEKLALGQRKFTPLSIVSDEFYAAHPNPYIRMFEDLARSPNVRIMPKTSVWQAYMAEMNIAAQRIFSDITSVDEALSEAEDRVQQMLDRDLKRWERVKDSRLEEWKSRL
ncbi:ABC transporter substrate-binding protein [Poriferisphaera sp. WC338]|uniref:ABC transporter substrate-binding protein n=1 Tax=Poriferisphaera sp. WC338 TaxID=3425129 RepID=UPI003D81996D